MTHSLLHQEGIGIGLERRQEIVDEAHRRYIDTFPETALEDYGFSNTGSFDNVAFDFDARLLPEVHPDFNPYDPRFQEFTNMNDRLQFLRGVASSIILSELEVGICANILGVRTAVLQEATKPKPTLIRELPRFLVAVEIQIAS